jgi:hypothetical protein
MSIVHEYSEKMRCVATARVSRGGRGNTSVVYTVILENMG